MSSWKQIIKSGTHHINRYPTFKQLIRRVIKLLPGSELSYKLRSATEREWDEETFQSKLGKFIFYYPSRSEIGLYVDEFGIWNDFSLLFQKLIRKPRVIIEVGANIGTDTLSIAQLAPKTCKIIAFEPVDRYRDILKKNIAINHLRNIEVYEYFVSSVGGETETLQINTTSASVIPNASSSFPTIGTQRVITITLDDFVRKNRISTLDLLKTDTDGFDEEVISGAKETIKRFRPFLFVEFSGYQLKRARGTSNETFAKLLHGLGYNKFMLFPGQRAQYIDLNDYRELLRHLNHEGSFDVLAIPQEKTL